MAKPEIGSTGWGGVLNDHLDDMATDITARQVAADLDVDTAALVAGGGATEAALSATFGLYVNVRAHGATGDGTTDDTAAIQAAIDALPPDGGAVFFPPGTYRTTGGITIAKPTLLVGAGAGQYRDTSVTHGASVIVTSSTTATVFTVTEHGFGMADLAVVNDATTPTAGTAVTISSGYSTTLTRCRFQGFYDLVDLTHSEYVAIDACWFMDPVRYGLRTRNLINSDQGDMAITSSFFGYGRLNRTGTSAVRWESGGGLRFIGNKINMGPAGVGKFQYGVDIAASDGTHTSVFLVCNNSIENTVECGIRIQHAGTSDIVISGFKITGNEIAYSKYGVLLAGNTGNLLESVMVSDNEFRSLSADSINVNYCKTVTVLPNSHRAVVGSLVEVQANNTALPVVHPQSCIEMALPVVHWYSDTKPIDAGIAANVVPYQLAMTMPPLSTTATTDLFTVKLHPYGPVRVRITFTGLIQGSGAGAYVSERLITRGNSSSSPAFTTVGTDTTAGTAITWTWATTTTGDATFRAQLAAGTSVDGNLLVEIIGAPLSIIQKS